MSLSLYPYDYLAFGTCTDIGRLRRRNEDAVFASARHAVFGVCDGLGGTEGGAEASQIIVRTVETLLNHPPLPAAIASHAYRVLLVTQAIRESGLQIRRYAEQHGYQGMGSTATFMLFGTAAERRVTLLHVGDTLAFRLRGQRMDRLFDPHSVEMEYGPAAAGMPPFIRHLLTRAVGISHHEQMEPTPVDVKPGDLFLIASDGLTNMIPISRIAALLAETPTAGPEATAQRMVDEANAAGGRDNISVIVVAVGKGSELVRADIRS